MNETRDPLEQTLRDEATDPTEEESALWSCLSNVTLLEAWTKAQPERVERAATLLQQATRARKRGDMARALTLGQEAIDDDPFSEALRERVAFWRTLASAKGL